MDNMDTIGKRVRFVRKKLGMTQQTLAERVGVKRQTISAMEAKGGGSHHLIQISQALAVRAEWLLYGTGHPTASSSHNVEPQDSAGTPSNSPLVPKVIERWVSSSGNAYLLVPQYDVSADSAEQRRFTNDQLVDHLAFKEQWILEEMQMDPAALALISSRGDSMEPTIRNADLMMIDMNQREVRDGAIFVMRNQSELFAKRLQRLMDGSILVRSDNSAYREEILQPKEQSDIGIIGKVVWFGRKL